MSLLISILAGAAASAFFTGRYDMATVVMLFAILLQLVDIKRVIQLKGK